MHQERMHKPKPCSSMSSYALLKSRASSIFDLWVWQVAGYKDIKPMVRVFIPATHLYPKMVLTYLYYFHRRIA